ncbi:hypothetical protein VPH35_131282 [Triticum aestivum]
MSSNVSPLHRVVDARRWEAEPLLGRLVIVVHAAFLEAGFIVPRRGNPSPCRLPPEVGATASTLSLEYTAPQLLPRHDMDGAALKICTVCSVRRTGGTYWACLDALSVAPVLSGGLDDMGRRLLGTASTLWRTVIDGLCRRLLLDLCREHGVVPGRAPTLMSLPSDAMLAILARLPDGKDLVRVESTCTELRRLVAGRERDRELWLPRYKALPGNTLWWSLRGGSDDDLPGTSWKEMYVWVARQREHRFQTPRWFPSAQPLFPSSWLSIHHLPRDLTSSLEKPDDVVICLTRFGKITREGDRGHGRGNAAAATGGGHEKQGRCTGAIHSPSSRHRWKHR